MTFRQTCLRGAAILVIGLCNLTSEAMALTAWCGEHQAPQLQHIAHSNCHAAEDISGAMGQPLTTGNAHHESADGCGCIQRYVTSTEAETPTPASTPQLQLHGRSGEHSVRTTRSAARYRYGAGAKPASTAQSAALLAVLRRVILQL
jgi:hypothetical protein